MEKRPKLYRGNYKKCYNWISLHAEWGNRINSAKKKTKAVQCWDEWTKIQSNNQNASHCQKKHQKPCRFYGKISRSYGQIRFVYPEIKRTADETAISKWFHRSILHCKQLFIEFAPSYLFFRDKPSLQGSLHIHVYMCCLEIYACGFYIKLWHLVAVMFAYLSIPMSYIWFMPTM